MQSGCIFTLIALSMLALPGASAQTAPTSGSIAPPAPSAPSTAAAIGVISSSAAATGHVSPPPPGPLAANEKKTLLSEFNRAQMNQEKALAHTQRSEMRQLTAAQSLKVRAWREKEKRDRRTFFDQNTSGPARRQYIQDYLKRKKEFDQTVRTEYDSTKKSWAEKRERLKQKQKEQRKQFKSQLDQGQRPDAALWPN